MTARQARDTVLSQLGLLRSRPQTILEAFNVLLHILGDEVRLQGRTAD